MATYANHNMTDEANTRCTECGYEWEYSGFGSSGKAVATCPNCGCKTPTKNMDATTTESQ